MGVVVLGMSGFVTVRQVRYVADWQGRFRSGSLSQGMSRQVRFGVEWYVELRYGMASFGRYGKEKNI